LRESRFRQIFRPWLWCAAAVAAFAGFVPVAAFGSAFAELLYLYLFLPLALGLVLLVGLVLAKRHTVSILVAVVVFGAVTWFLFNNTDAVQNTARWSLYGKQYRLRVLAERQPLGQWKHAEWNSWGLADSKTVVYLVYDPANSLAEAAKNHAAGTFAGIPCSVPQVSRLASHWYAVEFYANQSWNHCGVKPVEHKKTP